MEVKFAKKGFHVVKASAGSGKTYRLVRDYLACCLWENNPHYFKHILAITFTNLAAQEMKERILSDVREVAEGKGAMHGSLLEIIPIAPEELERRARALGEAMMHRYEDFSVMTIDSFVNRLVRSFSKDLQWEEDFQIELDEEALLDEAISRLLSRVGRPDEKALTAMLEGFVRQQVEEEKNAIIRHQLQSFSKQVTKENMQAALQALDPAEWTPEALERFRKTQREALRKRRAVPVDAAQVALARIAALGLQDLDFSYGDLPKWLRRVANGSGRKATIGKRLAAQLEDSVFWSSKASDSTAAQIQDAIPAIEQAAHAWRELYEGESGRVFKLQEHLQQRVSLIGTLGLIRDELAAVEEEKNVRLLSTLNREIAAIVRDNPAPFIYERIGNRYRNLFIDEFQDTSITQWHNLIQLFEHLVSLGEMGMVVGDGKQAIYRWRNGNYEQLEALPKLIGNPGPVLIEAAQALKRAHLPATLNFNRRSGSAIVDWNNRWFASVQRHLPESLQGVYDDVQQTPTAKHQGNVHLACLVQEKGVGKQDQRNAWVVQRILAHTGGALVDKGGTKRYVQPADASAYFSLSDIVVLLRRNKDGAALAQHLMDCGITPWTSESLHLGRHPVALAIVALLRSVIDPDNPAHVLAFVQNYCAIDRTASEAELLRSHRTVTVYLGSDGIERKRSSMDLRALFQAVAPELRPWELVTAPLTLLVGHCFEALDWSNRFPAYTEGMLELVHEVVTQRRGTLKDFLSHWDRRGHKRSIRVSGAQDAVQIMTPHKAKGLDFKVVIAPIHPEKIDRFKDEIPVRLDADRFGLPTALLRDSDLKDTVMDHERQAEIDRTVLDALNVAYVAATRAVDRLDIGLEFDKDPSADMAIQTLPQLLWKGWQEAFPERVDSATLKDNVGVPDRKASTVAEKSVGVDHVQRLALGQPYGQRIARPKLHWAALASEGQWTPIEHGNAVHGLLGELKHTADWPDLKERVERANLWTPDQRASVATLIESILHGDDTKRFFQAHATEVFAERTVHFGNGELGRPDRVVCFDAVWHVVDFKTGKERDKDKAQVAGYCEVLSAMHPNDAVKGWLIYTETLQLVNVPVLFGAS
ncbi:MAG: hypothetical protein CL828_03480 [Crocinitomicaceae bacterium]|nr:hypothetical protein [Crocinitomicaceae bacterium]